MASNFSVISLLFISLTYFTQIIVTNKKIAYVTHFNTLQPSITLSHLLPYANHNLTWRWKYYYTSWYNDPLFLNVLTHEDTPTEPRQLSSSSFTNTTVTLNWRDPEHMNGRLKEYVITCDSEYPIRFVIKINKYIKIINIKRECNFYYSQAIN